MVIRLYAALLAIISTTAISCRQSCSIYPYPLQAGYVTYSPPSDSLKVGDTIWVSSSVNFELKFQPVNGGDSMTENIEGASNMYTPFGVNNLSIPHTPTPGLDSFHLISDVGTLSKNSVDPTGTVDVGYSESDGSYRLRFGLVCLKAGAYCFSMLDIDHVKKKCFNARIGLVITNSDQHLHYLEDLFYQGQPIEELDQTRAYCIKVY